MRKRTVAAGVAAAGLLIGVAGYAQAQAAAGDTAITAVVVNGGSNVAVGITEPKTFTVAVTATDDSGIKAAEFYLYGPAEGFIGTTQAISCTASTATKSTCKASFTANPRVDLWDNDQAGTWTVAAQVEANDGDFVTDDTAGTFKLQRYSRLTVNATPEPVSGGGTLTVSGALTRANWELRTYSGYSGQSVKLQFRTPSGSYGDVKTVTSGSTGGVKTTVTASADGCWRYYFAGTSTTPLVAAPGDCVDVQ